jgi:hypothetical protein
VGLAWKMVRSQRHDLEGLMLDIFSNESEQDGKHYHVLKPACYFVLLFFLTEHQKGVAPLLLKTY